MVGILSKKADIFPAFLFENEKSLLSQSDAVKGRFQKDGWGIGYYTSGGELKLRKSGGFAAREKDDFAEKAGKARSRLLLAHIRAASNPNKLPASALKGAKNSQPFAFENFLFAHNGTLCVSEHVKKRLGRYSKHVKSGNDSEILFWQLMKMIDAYGDVEKAMMAAADETETIWFSVGSETKFRHSYKGLNMLLADGKNLYVMVKRIHEDSRRALMTGNWGFWDMALLKTENAAIVSSEPLGSDGGWKKIKSPRFVRVSIENGSVTLKTTQIEATKNP